jgi:CBS-domain-containing membrane protein
LTSVSDGKQIAAEPASGGVVPTLPVPPARSEVWQAGKETALAGFGGFVAIIALALAGEVVVTPLILAPFGSSAVLLFALPGSPYSRPRNVIGGHVVSALVGIAALAVLGPTPFAMAVGVGLAIVAMRFTGTIHPPAGAMPILVLLTAAPWWFFALPVGAGAMVMVASAYLYHHFVSGQAYPK